MTDKETFLVNWPGRIVFGAGKLAGLGEEAKALGGRHALPVLLSMSQIPTIAGLPRRRTQ